MFGAVRTLITPSFITKKHAKEWYDDISKLVTRQLEKQVNKNGRQQSIMGFGSSSNRPLMKYNSAKRSADLFWVRCIAKKMIFLLNLERNPSLGNGSTLAVPTNVHSQNTPTTPDTIRKYLPILENAIKKNALTQWKEALQLYAVPFAALENDVWKDATGVNYLGSILHWTVPNKTNKSDPDRIYVFIELKKIIGSHTGENLAVWQREVLEGWRFLDPLENTAFRAGKKDSVNGKLDMRQIIHSATPDIASNVQKALRLCTNVVLGCSTHRVALVLKIAIGGLLVTATNKMRELFESNKKRLHKESVKNQLDIFETLLDANNQEAMNDVNTPAFDSKPVSDMLLYFCATRSAFTTKSAKGVDKLVGAQEVLNYEKFTRAISNGGVRWISVYLMVKRDDLNCPAIQALIDDLKESLPGTDSLWGTARRKIQRDKLKSTKYIRTKYGENS
ncbi:hypothetical protein SARC_11772 [Sphaeroforma arctica JP610]|uniref:Uncharacterized protein n=1 Tax=Sphaeroforma arctica JP610 TaxID=667725 RepID=A0A0L0FG12_9EUKA|nr:hypothetical protein SARC_11772 [Sphaeroforma arctica JP610]KNC75709.1 hypothetical protein SARC_11772 [Sphaeroforma arctica JP610]|eukprot:XP_014149611.1 hypothetical protein SARC_11772 [Sphaeroforma arctica JP610]